MESGRNNQLFNDAASAPADREEQKLPLQPALNKLQFEEAVQRLREEHERHPNPASGTFY
jgi:hypothetical protein